MIRVQAMAVVASLVRAMASAALQVVDLKDIAWVTANSKVHSLAEHNLVVPSRVAIDR